MNRRKYIRKVHYYVLIIFLCLYCCDLATKSSEQDVQSATILVISGNNQIGNSNTELTNSIIIQVTDRLGTPASNIEIELNQVEGNGTFNLPTTNLTDADGIVQINWLIGDSYNAAKITLADYDINCEPIYIFATGDNPVGVDYTRSLITLKQEETNFYSMSFYGDYSYIISDVNYSRVGEGLLPPLLKYNCSLFSVFGNSTEYLFGRSFDNPIGWQCLTLIGKYYPINGYKSLAFSRMQDYGYQFDTEIENLSYDAKMRLFESVANIPDGINECGVVAGLANVQEVDYIPDAAKKTIWVTVLIRKILDNASNIEEAIVIANNYNLSCPDNNTLGIHIMVADATGKSAILEMSDGVLQVMYNTESWQVITNSPSYNVPIETQRSICSRFNYIYNLLVQNNGSLSIQEGLNILSNVGWDNGTEWSVIYNLTEKSLNAVIDYNFSQVYDFTIE